MLSQLLPSRLFTVLSSLHDLCAQSLFLRHSYHHSPSLWNANKIVFSIVMLSRHFSLYQRTVSVLSNIERAQCLPNFLFYMFFCICLFFLALFWSVFDFSPFVFIFTKSIGSLIEFWLCHLLQFFPLLGTIEY